MTLNRSVCVALFIVRIKWATVDASGRIGKNRLPKPGVLDRSSEFVDGLNSMSRNNYIRLSSQYIINNNIIKGVVTYKGRLQIASSYESPVR